MNDTAAAQKTWRVLLADDHTMVREALSHMLERLDPSLEIKHTNDAHEARRMLASDQNFSLLLLDYNMPGMSGERTIGELRSSYPAIPVGVISGYLPHKSIDPLIAAGAIGVFPKTMSGPTLLMALKLALAGEVYIPWQDNSPTFGVSSHEGYERSLVLQDMNDRQLRILNLIVAGEPNKAIARDVGLSEVSVKVQVAALCRKCSASNRTQLAAAAIRAGVKGDTAA